MSSEIDAFNKSAHGYHQSIYDRFIDLCRPMLAIGISNLYHFYARSDGRYFSVMTSLSMADYQFLETKHVGEFFTHNIERAGRRGKTFFVGGDVKRFSPTKDPLVHACWVHNFWNCLVHYELVDDHSLRGWGFCLGREFDDPASFFLDKMPLLDDFRSYLAVVGKDLIDTGDQGKLAVFEQTFKFSQRMPEDALIEKAIVFLRDSLKVHGDASLTVRPLTKRQSECLYYLSLYYSAKEIARNMGLSPRTVDDHLDAAKKKLGCSSKAELLGHARRHGFDPGGLAKNVPRTSRGAPLGPAGRQTGSDRLG